MFVRGVGAAAADPPARNIASHVGLHSPRDSSDDVVVHRLFRLVDEFAIGAPSQRAAVGGGVWREPPDRPSGLSHVVGVWHSGAVRRRLARVLSAPPQLSAGAELTVEETLALVALGHGLADEERGLPLQRAARRAIEKLGTQLPRALHAHLGDEPERGGAGPAKRTRGPRPTDDASAIEVRLEPRNALAGRQDVYDELVDAARRRIAVRIEYRSLSPAETLVTKLSPYRLLFSRRSWYVIGRSSVHRSVRTFNVGRIETLVRLEDTFVVPHDSRWRGTSATPGT